MLDIAMKNSSSERRSVDCERSVNDMLYAWYMEDNINKEYTGVITSITASIKGEQDLLVGNIIGSNIFNICIVLGVPVAIFGTIKANGFNMIDIAAFILSAIILYMFAKKKQTVGKKEGIFMVLLFILYYTLVFVI